MQESKFNFATVIALVVLMVFAYFVFMGLVYLKAGSIVAAVLMAVGLVVAVMVCVQVMCMAKATRWKRIGMLGQGLFGSAIFVLLMLSSLPLTSFFNVVGSQEELQDKVTAVCDAACSLDSDYVKYVDKRVEDYRQNLNVIARGQNVKPSLYQETLGAAPGSTNEQKIEGLTRSLRGSLMPDSITNVVNERHAWVDKTRNIVVWNPLTAANLAEVDKKVGGWADNYARLSAITYKGEEAQPFSNARFESEVSGLTATYGKVHAPSFLAILASLLCFVVMLLPYLVTRKSLAGATANSNVNYE